MKDNRIIQYGRILLSRKPPYLGKIFFYLRSKCQNLGTPLYLKNDFRSIPYRIYDTLQHVFAFLMQMFYFISCDFT